MAVGLNLERASLPCGEILDRDALRRIDSILEGNVCLVTALLFLEGAEAESVVLIGVRGGAAPCCVGGLSTIGILAALFLRPGSSFEDLSVGALEAEVESAFDTGAAT